MRVQVEFRNGQKEFFTVSDSKDIQKSLREIEQQENRRIIYFRRITGIAKQYKVTADNGEYYYQAETVNHAKELFRDDFGFNYIKILNVEEV